MITRPRAAPAAVYDRLTERGRKSFNWLLIGSFRMRVDRVPGVVGFEGSSLMRG